jgi:hypothetical protein
MKLILVSILTALSLAAQSAPPKVRSLTAEIVVTHTEPPGSGEQSTTEVRHYWRDSSGRTREEKGDVVAIADPTTQSQINLYLETGIAKVRVVSPASSLSTAASAGAEKPGPLPAVHEPTVSLGTRQIKGFEVRGYRASHTWLPGGPLGLVGPITHTVEMWISDELGLFLETKAESRATGTLTRSYRNIVVDADVDSSLFQVPSGFQVEQVALPTAR